jgi:hypothetical protein
MNKHIVKHIVLGAVKVNCSELYPKLTWGVS